MTLDQQIEAARKALEELTADEAELSRLHSEQGAEIASLKAGGSRDFAGLATLEGKRAALAAMLGEQRTSMAQTRARLAELEASARREAVVVMIGERAAQIEKARHDRLAAMVALRDALPVLLLSILDAEARWHTARREWTSMAEGLLPAVFETEAIRRGLRDESEARAEALYAELEARGVNTDALRRNPPGITHSVVGGVNSWPDALPPSPDPLTTELEGLVPALIGHAEAAKVYIARRQADQWGGPDWRP